MPLPVNPTPVGRDVAGDIRVPPVRRFGMPILLVAAALLCALIGGYTPFSKLLAHVPDLSVLSARAPVVTLHTGPARS